MRSAIRQMLWRACRLAFLAVIFFAVLRPIKPWVENLVYHHHPQHLLVTYYDSDGGDRVIHRHRVDRLLLDYSDDSKLGWLQDVPFFSRCEGTLRIPEDGKYTFEVTGEEHAVLYLNDAPLVDNQRALDIGKTCIGVATNLTRSTYALRLEHHHRTGNVWIRVKWKRGRSRFKVISVPDVQGL